ncbi:MAG: hypothetical protein ACOY4H_05480 [Thermodesulfobacteriota bacterium]
MSVWRFAISDNMVRYGHRERKMLLLHNGCNEPFKGRYWCPKAQWFRKEVCPFVNRNECEAFTQMCGCL